MTPPSKATLRKYGLSIEEWEEMHERAGGLCEICRRPTKRLCIDHEHQRGWRKMKPDRRKLAVRGVLCWFCNLHIVGRGVTMTKLESAIRYMRRHEVKLELAALSATNDHSRKML